MKISLNRIEHLSDLQGLKIRVPSKNTCRLIEACCATAESMPITRVCQSMYTGVVDGTLVYMFVLASFKQGKVTKFIARGLNATNSVVIPITKRDNWDDLDAETQALFAKMTGAGMPEGGRVAMTNAFDRSLAKWVEGGGEVIELLGEATAGFNAA